MTGTNPLRILSLISLAPFITSAFVILPEAFSNLETQSAYQHPIEPEISPPPSSKSDIAPLPLVIWHGLGDSYDADGIKATAKLAESINPGTYVRVIQLGDDGSSDRSATFFGNLTEQVEGACRQLAEDKILRTAPAINALGFSQGGQFLRAYVQRCNSPPVRNLVTFGSQHNGISEFQNCAGATDFICQSANALMKYGTWTEFVQSRLVPAQYFRDPEDLDSYLESSNFLADVNNERETKNERYADNIAQLNKFVMYMFANDTTVVPKQSAWFAEYNKTTKVVTPLSERKLFKEDWIGLKSLSEKGGLEFHVLKGGHMQFTDQDLKRVMQEYFGPVRIDIDGEITDTAGLGNVPEDGL